MHGVIGYYVHHHGGGHLARARCIAGALAASVTVLSSLDRPDGPDPFADWVTLPRDDAPDEPGGPSSRDHTAGGALHWAPRACAGYADRMAQVAAWVRRARPALVVVDVSVEVATLVRTLGVPVVVVAGPGRRSDAAHRLGHRLATALVAPWPGEVMAPAHLRPWRDKLVHVGAMSRFDDRRPRPPGGGHEVLVLTGRGGGSGPDPVAAQRATPGWRWRRAGPGAWAGPEELWELLEGSDVVVCHAGQNVLAEVAAARRPAVVVPQPRPFGEQRATARALDDAGIALALERAPRPGRWPELLERAVARGGEGWSRWNPGDGAARAARALDAVIGR